MQKYFVPVFAVTLVALIVVALGVAGIVPMPRTAPQALLVIAISLVFVNVVAGCTQKEP